LESLVTDIMTLYGDIKQTIEDCKPSQTKATLQAVEFDFLECIKDGLAVVQQIK